MKECENCGTQHEGIYGSGRFCSIKCSKGFSTKSKRKEINKKVSKKMTGIVSPLNGTGNSIIKLICHLCESVFEVAWNKRHQTTCSTKCAGRLRWQDHEYRDKIVKANSIIATNRHATGEKGFGWQVRNKLIPSYPESIAIRTLESLDIEYEYEMPLGKYFVDFAIHSKMIIIEIDGQQHNKPERKKVDDIKDSLLHMNGWKVYRIKWPKDNIIQSIKDILEEGS
jgi:hypothetical protein